MLVRSIDSFLVPSHSPAPADPEIGKQVTTSREMGTTLVGKLRDMKGPPVGHPTDNGDVTPQSFQPGNVSAFLT